MRCRRKQFTLTEVLIALAVLSLGILAATGLLSSARERSRVAGQQWHEQHIMAQAAEYFLIAGLEGTIPERFFPFKDYRVNGFETVPMGLPDGTPHEKSGWRLRTLHLQLRNDRNEVVRDLTIDRIIRSGGK